MSLTHARLLQVLRYDPETGYFWWLERAPKRVLSKPAGTQDKDSWYLQIMIDGVNYLGHRLAWFYMTGTWPTDEIDHDNRDKSDTRWANLRPATHKQNMENKAVRRDSGTGVKGVYWDEVRQKYQAYITHHKQKIHLGRYADIDAAVAARKQAEAELFTHASQ